MVITGHKSCGQGNIFTSVCLSTGGVCLSACWDTPPPRANPPSSRHPPWEQTTPPGADPLRNRHPPGADISTPPWEADSGIRSTNASYWMHSCSLKVVASQKFLVWLYCCNVSYFYYASFVASVNFDSLRNQNVYYFYEQVYVYVVQNEFSRVIHV